jgi:hypothetical protein
VFNGGVGAVRYRVARWLRSTVRSSALLVVVIALFAAVPIALAAAARRTATAPDRYDAANGLTLDVFANQENGRSLAAEVSTLPAARAVEAATFVYGQLAAADGTGLPDHIVFAGSPVVVGDPLVAGRRASADAPGEFVVAKPFAEANGLSIGDLVLLRTLSAEQVDETGFNPRPDMLVHDAVLVGLTDGPSDLNDPHDIAVFPPSLIDDERVGTSGSVIGVDLADGATVADLRQGLDSIERGELLRLDPASFVSAETRSAVGAQATGLWILAGLTAVATLVALGQLLVRHTRLSQEETSILSSLGATDGHIVGETTARAGAVVVIAAPLAAGAASAASGIFPFGFVRRLEPNPGLAVDVVVLLPGALLLAAGLVGWVVLATRVRRAEPDDVHHRWVDSMAARCRSSAMAVGIRFAYTSGDSATVASRFGGAVVMVAALAGTVTFATSLRRLVVEPAQYGRNFDGMVLPETAGAPEDLLRVLQSDPDITDVTLYTLTSAGVEDRDETLYVAGMEPLRGALGPHVLAGRLPVGPEEIAIGRVSARRLDAAIGDRLELTVGAAGVRYEITGLVVPHGIQGSDLVGQGGVVTSAGYSRLDPEGTPVGAAFRAVPGRASYELAQRIARATGSVPERAFSDDRPSGIRNVARITYVPFVLAVLLAVLAVLVVVSAASTAVRRRRHDVAVLRSMGADGRWLVRASGWQAIVTTLVPVAIGVPLGIVAGRLAFRTYADNLGTLNDASWPLAIIVLGVVALVVVAALSTTVAGRDARRVAPAALLRAE